jgi:hypothetical protein
VFVDCLINAIAALVMELWAKELETPDKKTKAHHSRY